MEQANNEQVDPAGLAQAAQRNAAGQQHVRDQYHNGGKEL